jgi:hypothetical protein
MSPNTFNLRKRIKECLQTVKAVYKRKLLSQLILKRKLHSELILLLHLGLSMRNKTGLKQIVKKIFSLLKSKLR